MKRQSGTHARTDSCAGIISKTAAAELKEVALQHPPKDQPQTLNPSCRLSDSLRGRKKGPRKKKQPTFIKTRREPLQRPSTTLQTPPHCRGRFCLSSTPRSSSASAHGREFCKGSVRVVCFLIIMWGVTSNHDYIYIYFFFFGGGGKRGLLGGPVRPPGSSTVWVFSKVHPG